MEVKSLYRQGKGFGLLGVVIALIIVCILALFALKTYIRDPAVDQPTKELLSDEQIDTSSQQAILDSTRNKIDTINKQILDNAKQFEDLQSN